MSKYFDNTVRASYLGWRGAAQSGDSTFSTLQLLQGEVKSTIAPNSPKSRSTKFWEYEVAVAYREGHGPVNTITYSHCLAASLFGGAGDCLRVRFRADPQTPDDRPYGNGAQVLILCVNGAETEAIIVGGLPVAADPAEPLYMEFNGVRLTVNDDGELKLLVRGKTNVDGTLADDNQPSGSFFSIDKNGNLVLGSPNSSQTVTIDNANGQVTVSAKNLELDASGNADIKVTDTAGLKAKTVNVTANTTNINSQVNVGLATDSMLKGDTYRLAQSTLNQSLIAALQVVMGSLVATAAALAAAGITAPAASALTPSIAAIGQAIGALTTFEAGAPTFLSRHKID
jgi:phage baseplate assembly protein gpV